MDKKLAAPSADEFEDVTPKIQDYGWVQIDE